MFKIIKKGSNNFWHVFDNGAKNVAISDFEVVLDDVLNTFVIVLRNGANIPQIALSINNIIVIDETASGVEESGFNAVTLRARLVVLGYTAYLGAGNADAITGLIEAGTNVTITGTGTLSDPYVISSSGTSGTTPTLQEVTTAGNETTNDVRQIGGKIGTFANIGSDDDGAYLEYGTLNLQFPATSGKTTITPIDVDLASFVTLKIPNKSTGEYIIATEDFALKRDGSNANSDVDLGTTYGIKASTVTIQNNSASKSMKLLASNMNNERTAEFQDKDYTGIADITDIPDVSGKEDTSNKSSSYTASSTTTYPNTKALVDGLATKQDALLYTPFKFIQASQTAHTGTTAETILATATIPANTFSSNEILKALFGINKTGTAGAYTIRIRINTSNTLSGATTIATFTAGSGSAQLTVLSRNFTLLSGNLYGYPFATSQVNDVMNVAGTLGSTTYNTANTLYVFWTATLVNSGDSLTPNLANLTN